MKAVMLLAGDSTRMRPLTYTKPKPLLQVAGKTILQHNLEQLKKSGIRDVILVVGYLQDKIKNFLKNNSFGMNLKFVSQEQRMGTGHALLQAKDMIKDETFLVMCGDDIYHSDDIKKCLKSGLCLLANEKENPENFASVEVEKGFVKNIIEKPKNPDSKLTNTGLYVMNKDIFNFLEDVKKSPRDEFEVTDAVFKMCGKHPVKCVIAGKWVPIGYPWDLLIANEMLMKEIVSNVPAAEKNVMMKGSVSVGKNTIIKSGAYIEGPVIIGSNCTIGPNCFIRVNSVIGNGCRIGNAVEVKNTIIGDNTKIEHLSYVGDSVIGDNCNLAAGTIIANLRHDNKSIRLNVKGQMVDTGRRKFGVVMGDYTKTGIKTSIYPGIMMGPFSWTSPGFVAKENVKPLTLDGSKFLSESKFDSNLAGEISFVKEAISK
ncbi:MAG: NTP transferase domain-containing protein [Candidatus Aenigmarchaeota archaeon]|nr:NTP transferase domain-containing protein [Candidatus Aenigmarchaeota archaeon]